MSFDYFRSEYRLRVAGAAGGDFQIWFVPDGRKTRDETGGPFTYGPKLGAFGLGVCIAADPRMGSAADADRARQEHRLIEAEIGDLFVIDGEIFQLDWHRFAGQADRHNVRFTHVGSEES